MRLHLTRCPDCGAAFGHTREYGCQTCGYKYGLTTMKLDDARRQQVFERDGHRCVFCGTAGDPWDNPIGIDHITPQIDGGSNRLQNLQTCCRRCNSRKSDRAIVPVPWYGYGDSEPINWRKDPEQRERRRARRAAWAY